MFTFILLKLEFVNAIVATLFNYNTPSLFIRVNFTNPSKYSNSLGIVKIISIGLRAYSWLGLRFQKKEKRLQNFYGVTFCK
jgi:hypothetical protein